MISTIEVLLSPIIQLMTVTLSALFALFGNYGLAIVGVSAIVQLATHPISKAAERLEERERRKQSDMAAELAEAKNRYTGRERFEAIDAIYQAHGYHPINSTVSLVPLLLQIPFLLSALFLFSDYPPLRDTSFLFIGDLSAPDRLATIGNMIHINVLPITLAAVAIFDSIIKPNSTRRSRLQFLIITAVLLLLIYPLPAAVCLYWLTSNMWSLLSSIISSLRSEASLSDV